MPGERVRHTRSGVVQRTQHEFEQLDALVNRLDAADWARPLRRSETKDPWTVKDALAHIVYWKWNTMRAMRREPMPSEIKGLSISQQNHVVYERWRDRSPDDVAAWHRAVQAEVMNTLEALPEEYFTRRERAPYWPGDFDGHSAEHRVKDIERAFER
jgi:hypothetical protein